MAATIPGGGNNVPGDANSTTPTSPSTTDTTTGPATSTGNFHMTDGWYVALACIGSVMVADTRVGPIAFGILTLAFIYQLTLLLEGK